jgi:hypothetical protein
VTIKFLIARNKGPSTRQILVARPGPDKPGNQVTVCFAGGAVMPGRLWPAPLSDVTKAQLSNSRNDCNGVKQGIWRQDGSGSALERNAQAPVVQTGTHLISANGQIQKS